MAEQASDGGGWWQAPPRLLCTPPAPVRSPRRTAGWRPDFEKRPQIRVLSPTPTPGPLSPPLASSFLRSPRCRKSDRKSGRLGTSGGLTPEHAGARGRSQAPLPPARPPQLAAGAPLGPPRGRLCAGPCSPAPSCPPQVPREVASPSPPEALAPGRARGCAPGPLPPAMAPERQSVPTSAHTPGLLPAAPHALARRWRTGPCGHQGAGLPSVCGSSGVKGLRSRASRFIYRPASRKANVMR